MSVYFNIRGEKSVIQASLNEGECILLKQKKQEVLKFIPLKCLKFIPLKCSSIKTLK